MRPELYVSRLVLIIAVVGGGFVSVPRASQQTGAELRCELPPSAVLRTEGNARLEMWEIPASPVWLSENLRDTPGYAAFRAAIRMAGGDLTRPVADPPQPKDDAERELWRREELNERLMYEGGGQVHRIRCLEAVLFARQDARYSEIARPTEFAAHLLSRNGRFKIYMGASDQMFPPKSVYGINEVKADVAAGWQYAAVLHNHTVRALNGKPALGVPAPSTSDVELFRGLVVDLGLREVWVTNGIFTGVVSAESLGRFATR